MIDIDTTFYPLIILRFFPSEWDISQFYETIQYFTELFQIPGKERIKLFIIGNNNLGPDCAPSLRYLLQVASNVIKNINMFRDNVEFTAIYQPNDSLDFFFTYILCTFTARNPLHSFKDMDLAYAWLNENGIEKSCLDIVCGDYGYPSNINQSKSFA